MSANVNQTMVSFKMKQKFLRKFMEYFEPFLTVAIKKNRIRIHNTIKNILFFDIYDAGRFRLVDYHIEMGIYI